MREIGSDTGGVDDIVEGELINERRELEEEGQGLRHIWSAYVAFISTCEPRISARDLPRPKLGYNTPVRYRQRRQQQLRIMSASCHRRLKLQKSADGRCV